MNQTLRPQIVDDKIVNIKAIVEAIKVCNDLPLLEEYQEETLAYAKGHNPQGLMALEAALSLRIEALKQPVSDTKASESSSPLGTLNSTSDVNLVELNELLGKLYQGIEISTQEKNQMETFANQLLDEMEAEYAE